jgi:HD-GYP domain-containing protein (c-di-GMP phosphodiesterase class II)
MEALKKYLLRNFEQLFVLLILVSVAGINYLIPYKLAFLNFYFIPILLAAYYLGVRSALLGSVLCALVVVIYVYLFPATFMPALTHLDLWMNIVTWASFLILTAALVGQLTTKLKMEVGQVRELNRDLEESKIRLEGADRALRDHAENLEAKVTERTKSLETSKHAIEELKKKVEEALYSTMDASVVKLIIEKRLRTEKRKVSILFSDLKNFTQFSEERRPEMVITDLNRLLEEMEEVLLDYHAHIDKYLGDGIMVEFGAPIDYERHALMAIIAGLKMQERVNNGKYPWQMRVGIATGEPIIGLIGHHRQTYTAIGDTVNLASRIQEICTPGLVTIDAATYDEVARYVNVRKKSIITDTETKDPKFVQETSNFFEKLQENPDDVKVLKELGSHFLKHGDVIQAHEHLSRAMGIDPDDDELKLAYADVSLKMSQMDAVAIRGKKARLHLYEVLELKNPLLATDIIPRELYEKYHQEVDETFTFPEDIVLPMEAVDGSVGHSRVVGFLCYALADLIGLTPKDKLEVLQAGYLADLGKEVIPHHLLNRAGSLSKEEFEGVAKHSRESVRTIRKMGYESKSLLEIVEFSHESFNGSGYPEGISGEDIPIGARILSVADTYSGLTSWRPYRDRWDNRAAFSEMGRETKKGKFDPRVIESLGKLIGVESL